MAFLGKQINKSCKPRGEAKYFNGNYCTKRYVDGVTGGGHTAVRLFTKKQAINMYMKGNGLANYCQVFCFRRHTTRATSLLFGNLLGSHLSLKKVTSVSHQTTAL